MGDNNLTKLDTEYRYFEVTSIGDLPEGERIFVEFGDRAMMILNISGEYFAIGDVCTHDEGPLGDGLLEGCTIVCPRHGARFDIRTGKALSLPAVIGIPTYPVRVMNGKIEIGIPVEKA